MAGNQTGISQERYVEAYPSYRQYISIHISVVPATTALITTTTSGKHPSASGTTKPPSNTTSNYPSTSPTTAAPATTGPTNDYPSTLKLISPRTKASNANAFCAH